LRGTRRLVSDPGLAIKPSTSVDTPYADTIGGGLSLVLMVTSAASTRR